jgi:hypothetical protein
MPKLLEPSAEWPTAVQDEFTKNQFNPCVGTRLLSQTERVRVWEVRLKPSERLGFHRHVLDYFWVATTPGKARLHQQDESWLGKFGQRDKWSFRLRAARMAAEQEKR